MSKRILVEFSGWVDLDLDKTTFYYVGNYPIGTFDTHAITARDWLELPLDERENWVLEDLGQAYQYQNDGELQQCDITVEEEDCLE